MRTKLARYMTNLEHFATVVKYGNISAAASVLAITQPALTRSVMRLEDVLGVQLLHRLARGVKPTDCGKALLDYIDAAEAELVKAQAMIETMKGSSEGRINCGAGSVSMNHIVPVALSAMLKKQNRVHINLVEGRTPELLLKLRNGELDLVLGIEQPGELFNEFHSEHLLEERFHFCGVRRHVRPPHDPWQFKQLVAHEKLVTPVLGGPLGRAMQAELERLGAVMTEHRVETLSYAVARHLVLHDDYIAFCSSVVFGEEMRSGAMQVLSGDWQFPGFGTRVFRRRDEVVPATLERFIDELHRAAAAYEAAAA
jgi:DNA-binding transcriptional LysR family regulator